jgi:TPR repeat protein
MTLSAAAGLNQSPFCGTASADLGYTGNTRTLRGFGGGAQGYRRRLVRVSCEANMHDGWRLEVAELRVAKRDAEALALIRQAIDEGDMSARVMLATMGDRAGLSRSEVDQLIDDVESGMDPNDVETHLELRGAYDVRLGNLSYDEKARRCFDHHLKAVELGAGPVWTLALARIYVMGSLEVRPDQEQAIRWYKHAIEQGSIEAANELQKYCRHIEKSRKDP